MVEEASDEPLRLGGTDRGAAPGDGDEEGAGDGRVSVAATAEDGDNGNDGSTKEGGEVGGEVG